MSDRALLYYITDRKAFPGSESDRRRRLLEKIAEAARCGVDYIQLREKDLSSRELESLAGEAASILRETAQARTRFLINSRTDVALGAGADGVHLRSDDVAPSDVRVAWKCGAPARETLSAVPVIAVSCHSVDEVAQAARNQASFAVFAPVFEKKDAAGNRAAGLSALRTACREGIPILALGGVTLQNAQSCLEAGAAGIAAIRLFQENDIATIVRGVRG